MQTASLVPIEEYLASSYEPDCDYVDGVIEERNLGEWSHSRPQHLISRYLGNREREWNVLISVEQRIRVSPTRIRIPDVCIVPADREIEPVPTQPPLVCIEVLSPEDRWARMERRIEDFLAMGVERVWVFDPEERRVFDCSRTGYHEVIGDLLELPGTPICIRLSELMADLD